jgi:hypothetical protein
LDGIATQLQKRPMFARRVTIALLLAGYALPAILGRGLHGDDPCVPCALWARAAGHDHAGCGHDHSAPRTGAGAARIAQGSPHDQPAHGDCDLCLYLAQAQCAADPGTAAPEPQPLAAARAVHSGWSVSAPAGLHPARGPPARISA